MKTTSVDTLSGPNIDKRAGEAHSVHVVYLAGTSCCGSTLISFLLNAHPQILSIGEISPIAEAERNGFKCSCDVELVKCPFVLAVKDLIEKKYDIPFDVAHWELRHRYSKSSFWNRLMIGELGHPLLNYSRDAVRTLIPSYRVRMNYCTRRNEAFIRAALEVSKKQVFFDATKIPMRIPFLQGIRGINLKVLHVVRDPRGYVSSICKKEGKSARIASQEWVKVNKNVEHNLYWLETGQWMRLRFESLCINLEKSLTLLTEFIKVKDFASKIDNYRAKPHHIIGNRMRLSSDGRKTVKLEEKWRLFLSKDDLEVVKSIAGSLARKYGYDI